MEEEKKATCLQPIWHKPMADGGMAKAPFSVSLHPCLLIFWLSIGGEKLSAFYLLGTLWVFNGKSLFTNFQRQIRRGGSNKIQFFFNQESQPETFHP